MYFPFIFVDKLVSRASEAAISGDDDYDLSEYNIPPGLENLLDLAVGENREPALTIWDNMQEYALNKGMYDYDLSYILHTCKDSNQIWKHDRCSYIQQLPVQAQSVVNS